MKQKQTLPNSHSESSQDNFPVHISRRIYENHMSELVTWSSLFGKEKLKLDELQSAALVGCIKDLAEEFNLDSMAMDMEDVIKILLEKITYDDQLTVTGRYKHASQIEQLLRLSRILRVIDQNIIPYTQP